MRFGVELHGVPVGGGEGLLQAVGRREFLSALGAPPEVGEIAAGDVEGTVGEAGEFEGA